MEHILSRYIREFFFLEGHTVRYRKQHDFTAGLSTVTKHFGVTHDTNSSFNEKQLVDFISINFSRGFHRVPNGNLVQKHKILDLHSSILGWLEAYFSNRTHIINYMLLQKFLRGLYGCHCCF